MPPVVLGDIAQPPIILLDDRLPWLARAQRLILLRHHRQPAKVHLDWQRFLGPQGAIIIEDHHPRFRREKVDAPSFVTRATKSRNARLAAVIPSRERQLFFSFICQRTFRCPR